MTKNTSKTFIDYLIECKANKEKLTTDRIRKIRKHFNLTQVAFSEFIMVGYETYRSWEEGRRIPSSPGYAILLIAEKYPEVFIKNRKDVIEEFNLFCKPN
ncbi:MAG: helix-turn-helix domain-containing protein [Rickettsiaceae bacterium]|nr:MAG: helix-turn-helix domain-containing protein [Rickettsiaceae bacterium]